MINSQKLECLVQTGVVESAELVPTADGFTLEVSLPSDETEKHKLYTHRNDVRTFKSLDSAYKTAVKIGFKEVILKIT